MESGDLYRDSESLESKEGTTPSNDTPIQQQGSNRSSPRSSIKSGSKSTPKSSHRSSLKSVESESLRASAVPNDVADKLDLGKGADVDSKSVPDAQGEETHKERSRERPARDKKRSSRRKHTHEKAPKVEGELEIDVEERESLEVKLVEGEAAKNSREIVPFNNHGDVAIPTDLRVEMFKGDSELIEDLESYQASRRYSVILNSSTSIYKRNEFVRKTLFVVLLQAFFSFTFMSISYLTRGASDFFAGFYYFAIIAGLVLLATMITLAVKPGLVRNTLEQCVIIPIMTFMVTLIITTSCCKLKAPEIIGANVVFAVTLIFLILLTTQKRFELTSWIGHLCSILFVVVSYCIYGPFAMDRLTPLLITAFGVLFVVIYIMLDIQLMVNGKRSYTYKTSDHRMAAIALYYDSFRLVGHVFKLLKR